jgi:hypothetical protein
MKVSGPTIVVGIFALAIALSGAAWWHRLQESRHAAAYWGQESAPLVVGDTEVKFLVLGAPAGGPSDAEQVAGRAIDKSFDMTIQSGLVHMRYALTQDANFEWDKLRDEPLEESLGADDWTYALRFSQGDRQLDVLLTRDLGAIGKVDAAAGRVKVVPCPHLAPKLRRYLVDIKAPLST